MIFYTRNSQKYKNTKLYKFHQKSTKLQNSENSPPDPKTFPNISENFQTLKSAEKIMFPNF